MMRIYALEVCYHNSFPYAVCKHVKAYCAIISQYYVKFPFNNGDIFPYRSALLMVILRWTTVSGSWMTSVLVLALSASDCFTMPQKNCSNSDLHFVHRVS